MIPENLTWNRSKKPAEMGKGLKQPGECQTFIEEMAILLKKLDTEIEMSKRMNKGRAGR